MMYQGTTIHTNSHEDLVISIHPTIYPGAETTPFATIVLDIQVAGESHIVQIFHRGRWAVKGPTMGLSAADAMATTTPLQSTLASPECPDCHGTGYAQVDEDEVAACGCPRMAIVR